MTPQQKAGILIDHLSRSFGTMYTPRRSSRASPPIEFFHRLTFERNTNPTQPRTTTMILRSQEDEEEVGSEAASPFRDDDGFIRQEAPRAAPGNKDLSVAEDVITEWMWVITSIRKSSRIRGTRQDRSFIQRIVATHDQGSVPLLYLEAMMFPSIFWKLAEPDGGFLGAIPSPLLTNVNARTAGVEVASLADHANIRLTMPGSTAASDPRFLSFTFDAVANASMEIKMHE